jgi:homoserine dehydrogenase
VVQENVIVLKFGSSVLPSNADLPNAVHEIYRWYRVGYRVVAVVSAVGLTTDELLCEARGLTAEPDSHATAELLATGERAAAARLGVLLDRAGVPARVLNPHEINLTVEGGPLDANPAGLDVARLNLFLTEYPVLVIPGFFGIDARGRTHLLGRGGSDLTAVFLAQALRRARCRLIKDVDGVYESDPARVEALDETSAAQTRSPARYAAINYPDAQMVAGALIQPKAVIFLQEQGGQAEVASLASGHESQVGSGPTRLASAVPFSSPSRVLLLGLGTVGLGVYQRLLANPQHFDVVGAFVRDRRKHEERGIAPRLLTTQKERLVVLQPDLVVDVLPGLEPSRELVELFLAAGIPVISANKSLIAELSPASPTPALTYSASVGGGTPMIEWVERAKAEAPIAALTAVLNGTCNYVLERCAAGDTLRTALSEVRRAGFTEGDAEEDLSGRDAERRLRILCRHAFGKEPERVKLQWLDGVVGRRAEAVRQEGEILRQVARAVSGSGEVKASVRFEALTADSPFATIKREWNALAIETHSGARHFITGRGAGRWPTTEAVVADLFEARRALIARHIELATPK